jgi:hypothetical protein
VEGLFALINHDALPGQHKTSERKIDFRCAAKKLSWWKGGLPCVGELVPRSRSFRQSGGKAVCLVWVSWYQGHEVSDKAVEGLFALCG